VLLDLAAVAALLALGNMLCRHFDPKLPLWRRFAKSAITLAATAIISYRFGHYGVLIAFGIAILRTARLGVAGLLAA
jgi:hypothetical protein